MNNLNIPEINMTSKDSGSRVIEDFFFSWKFIVLIALSIIVLIIFLYQLGLDTAQKISSIFGSLSVVVALLTYHYKKEQDKILSAIDQVTFFREKIITEWDRVHGYIIEKYPSYIPSRIKLINPDIDYLRKEYSVNFERQSKIFLDASIKYPDVVVDKVLDRQILMLNMLEEFSLRVIYLGTINNDVFKSIHNTFVEIVEKNAIALLFMRDVKTGNHAYSAILSLYDSWQKKTEDANYVKNLEKFGFITKKQKEDIHKKRKEIFSL